MKRAAGDPKQTFGGTRFFATMIRKLYIAVLLGVALAGCETEPKFTLSSVNMDCDQSSCVVSFDVTNASDGMLPLIYDVSLNQNYIRDPNRSIVVVGTADGKVELPPTETKTIEVEIEVTEIPNGSKISMFDSRTPKIVLAISNWILF